MIAQDATPVPRGAAYEFLILGPLEVLCDRVALPLPGPRPRALLAVLLVHANERVSSDRLAEDVWDGRPPATARSALQMHVHALRQALGADLPLRTVPRGYVLTVESGGTDASAFERSVADGRRALAAGRAEEASQRLRAALLLWRGSALEEFTDASFARLEAARLEELRLLGLELQFDAELALGRHDELVPELTRLVAAHPARERLHAQLMRALYRGGRQADALAEFQRARHYLVEELGLEPSAELQQLQAAVLAHDPALELEVAVPGVAPRREPAPPPIPAASRSAMEDERKQVTVLSCGVAGSTALTQALGPDGTHEVFGALFRLSLEKIQLYEGTISQFMADGFIALFGAPIAHEDHARRAVLAALALRDTVKHADLGAPPDRPLELRMGVNSGEVVVGSIGDDLRMDYTAFGDTSVLAASLQAAARSDEILMSQATAQLLEGYVLVENAPPAQIKERVVRPVRVLDVGPRLSRVDTVGGRRLSRFVGRQQEVTRLRRLLADVRAGASRLATITGEPGIGKSRVLLELRRAAAELGFSYVEGRCLSFGHSIPYLPILELLRERCHIAGADTDEVIAGKLAIALQAAGADVDRALPYLLRVQALAHGAAEIASLDSATVKARTFDVLQRVLLGDRGSALVLAVEDMQWIDRTSEDLLKALSQRIVGRPVLLVGTTRPEYSPPWDGVVEKLTLDSLSPTESAAVVRALVPRADADGVTRAIIDRGAGNPLFLEELAGAVREHGGQAALEVPGTLQSVLAARIDRLPHEAKRALQTASVLGRRFARAYLETLWDKPVPLGAQLALLEDRDFLHRDQDERRAFSFKHALTHEVAYNSLLLTHRQALHKRAGDALESIHADRLEQYVELLAHHYARSDDAEKAFRYLEQANAKAARANAMEEATAYFYQALKALDRLPETEENRRRRLTILLDQTGEFHLLHRHREYYELLIQHEGLARELGDPGLLGEFYARLGHRQWTVFADMERAVETLTRAAQLCERADSPIGAASAYAILEWSFLFTGPLDGVDRHLHKARAKLDEEFHPHWYMWALSAAVLAHTYAGRWRAAIATGEEAVALGERRGEDGIVSFAAAWLAYARLAQGDWHGAIAYAELGLASAPTIYFQGFSQAHLAAAFCHTQNAEQGVPILKAISEMLRASEHLPGWMHVASLLAEGQLEQSDVDAAATTAEEVADVSGRAHARYYVSTSQRLLAEAALIRGDLAKAERHVEHSLSVARQLGAENALALARAVRGRIKLLRGETRGAQLDLQESLEVFERLGTVGFPRRIRDDVAAVRS